MRVLTLVLTLALAGCASTPVVLIPPLPECAEIVLPRIPADELTCVSDAAYEALVVRDQTLQNERARLCAIIQGHNEAGR